MRKQSDGVRLWGLGSGARWIANVGAELARDERGDSFENENENEKENDFGGDGGGAGFWKS